MVGQVRQGAQASTAKLQVYLAPALSKKAKPISAHCVRTLVRRTSSHFARQIRFSRTRPPRSPCEAMKTAIISARYTEQYALDDFFQSVFGFGKASVTVSNKFLFKRRC